MAPVYNKGQNVMDRQRGQSIFKITALVGCSSLQWSVSIKRGRYRRDSDDRVMGGQGSCTWGAKTPQFVVYGAVHSNRPVRMPMVTHATESTNNGNEHQNWHQHSIMQVVIMLDLIGLFIYLFILKNT